MSDSKRSCTRLFNNPVLSDVQIKQTYNGHTREYHAHKAVLCQESDYFLKAFTGNFKESSEAIIELHEDDPEHFEFVLEFIYTGAYNKHEITKLAGDDKNKRVLIPIGVHAIADKYDVAKLYKPAAEDVKAVLVETVKDQDMLNTAIHAHYGTEVDVDAAMGRLITSVVFEKHKDLVTTEKFEQLLLKYPTFAADAALHSQRSNTLFRAALAICRPCGMQAVHVEPMRRVGYSSFICPKCGARNDFPST